MKTAWRLGLVAAGVVVALGTAVVAEAQSVIEARQNVMKSFGASNRVMVPMVRGEQPFNLAAAKQAATTIMNGSKQIPGAFPAGSEGGNALPVIWQNKADFETKAKNLEAAATRLANASDEASFKAAFPAVGQACGGCHQTYRKPQS